MSPRNIAFATLLLAASARAEVILQYFETDWDEIYKRIPEISEIGYDALWIPSPCKSPVAGNNKYANVGYSLYDRFDLGDIPQRGTTETRYGDRGELRQMVDHLHFGDVKVYPDIVFNHNGNGPNYLEYPGMKVNDFHAWQDGGQPGGWKRAQRMTGYDDISNGYGQTFQQELVSLIDVVTEPDGRFSSGAPNYAAEPAPFVRHPGQYDKYPYNAPGSTLPSENVRQMLGRWAAWLGNAMDYDGFRLDAGKHVVREFYGGPGSGFLHEAQWNFDQRRGNTYNSNVPDLYTNDIRRKDMLMFNEIFTGSSSTFDYWRQGNVKMRYLDFPQKQSIVGDAFSNGNLAALASLGIALDPTEGVGFVQSHDQSGPNKLELAYAWLLTKSGVPIVYFSGNNISWDDKNTGKTWVLPGTGNALGDYNNVIPNLVYISNQFARGKEYSRWSEGDFAAFERYTDTNGNSTPDSGETTLLVALNDSGSDQTRNVQTSFPPFTVLKDYTGNNGTVVTVNSSGQANITVPARSGQGFVCYAPLVAEGPASGQALRFTQGGTEVGTMPWVVPGGRDAASKTRTIPRITGNSVDIEIHFTNPSGGSVDSGMVKWGQGRDLNASATDYTDNGTVTGGFEQCTYSGGAWKLTADLTNVPEGLHTIKGRLFNARSAGLPALYQTFSRTVYVDRTGPSIAIETPAASSTVNGDVVAVIRNDDRTASRMEYRIDSGAWADATYMQRQLWKASLSGLSAGSHTLEVRATETDQGATPATINTSTASTTFTVNSPAFTLAMNHAEGQTLTQPFFQTVLTVPSGTTPSNVKLWWDGYEMTGLSVAGTSVTHTFTGAYTSGGVAQRLSGAFVNGPHFFEAEVTSGGVTKRISRKVIFNLYGQNLTDSDGDGLPDDVELPGFGSGNYAAQKFPGDNNEDTIPNYGENWSRTNPLNENTDYAGSWDGDEDWDGDGVSNLQEVIRGYQDHGNAFYYNVYSASSTPSATVTSTATWSRTPTGGGAQSMLITYRPNNGPLSGQSPIEVKLTLNGGSPAYHAMTSDGNGGWTYTAALPAGSTLASMSFQTPGGSIIDTNSAWENIDVTLVVEAFSMDGTLDSANYLVADNGMRIWAAVKGNKLYFATWSADGSTTNADHFLLCTNNFGNSSPNPWAKAGSSKFWFDGWPWLVSESGPVASTYYTLNNGGSSGRFAMGTSGNVLEGEIDLVEVFGGVPKVLYFTSLAIGDNDGDGIVSQCPAAWSADNDVTIPEYAAIRVDSIRDEDSDGYHDRGHPSITSTVDGDTADANYGLRRFFIDEAAGQTANITLNFTIDANPSETLSNVEVITNLNRREKAAIQEDRSLVTTSSDTYFRAYPMTENAGTWSATIPVSKCGAYRATVRYQLDGETHFFTDGGLSRDLAIVVTPTKALNVNMYEVNPAIVEATSDAKADRSTFRDLWMANTDRPDVVNKAHFTSLGVNMLWLQPIHPIGVESRGLDPDTGLPYDPGSPYAVQDYWKVAPALGADDTAAGAMAEFQTAVAELDSVGVGVMMDGTFNHSAPDAVFGQGAVDLFPALAGDAASQIRNVRPGWYSETGNYSLPAPSPTDVAVAPDRSDFGKWEDVRDFYFGNYDALVKYASDSHQEEYLLERDDVDTLSQETKDLWDYFAYYPIYWLEKTGHPVGTPAAQAEKGIDGLRCDFAQGLPSEFWEYCINKTRSVKWNFLFMAESLDGYREVSGSKRHGVGYRSARHFDILNENIVFYWRDKFGYPFNGWNGQGTAPMPNYGLDTASTWEAYDNRRNAFEGVVLLNNLTSHDEVFPSNDPYLMLNVYAQLGALDGIPLIMYGQEAGAQNDYTTYGFTSTTNAPLTSDAHNWSRYETNFGKTIPNFKRWNDMANVWTNRDWTVQDYYGRIGRARLASDALRSRSNYFLSQTSGGWDPNIFAVAKFETPGVSASQQDVVLCFANNNYETSASRANTFSLDATTSTGANWFGIEAGHTYNVVNLLSSTPTAHLWGTDRTGADLIANGIYVGLDGGTIADRTTWNQAQYLRLVDTSVVDPDSDDDGMDDEWEILYGLNVGIDDSAADLDGDGTSNLVEFQLGLTPDDGTSRFASVLTATQVTWTGDPAKTYVVQRSTDLQSWTNIGTTTGNSIARPPGDVSPSPEKVFYRVCFQAQ